LKTVAENLRQAATSICGSFEVLYPTNVVLRDVNTPGSGIICCGPSHVLPKLDDEHRRIRSRTRADLDHFMAIVNALLHSQPKAVRRSFSEAERTLRSVVDESRVHFRSTDELKAGVRGSIEDLLALVGGLHDDSEGLTLLVPDTNALLSGPALESWCYEDMDAFQIVLVPSVLAELDELKISHHNPEVRDKAKALIRQVKELRRRGTLIDGVTVVRDRITLRALAVEPNLDASFPWLDRTNDDDRILASCVEVMRAHPRCVVLLVTGDINLQNKAEFALVPFIESPAGV
jgi:hypothetical protein